MKQKVPLNVFKFICAAALIGLLITTIDWGEVVSQLALMRWMLLALSIILNLHGMLLSSAKLRILLVHQRFRIPLALLTRIYMISSFFNNFLPGSIGGDTVKYIYLVGHGCTKRGALLSIVFERGSGFVTIFLGALSFLILYGSRLGVVSLTATSFRLPLLVLVLLFALGIGTFLLWPWIKPRLDRYQHFRKFAEKGTSLLSASRQMATSPRLMAQVFFWSILFQVNVSLVLYALAVGLSLPLTFPAVIFISLLYQLVMMLPLTIHGVGLREWAFVYLLGLFQISAEAALAFSLAVWLSAIAASTFGGILYGFDRNRPDIGPVTKTDSKSP